MWLGDEPNPPCPFSPDALMVGYFTSAEWGCYLALGWPLPGYIIDLYAEFRVMTNGKVLPGGKGLLGACALYGIKDTVSSEFKKNSRDRILEGPPYTREEQDWILKYNQSDVSVTVALFKRLQVKFNEPASLGRALLRGRYTAAVATMEWNGVPIDYPTLNVLRRKWEDVRKQLIEEVDQEFGVYEGTTFHEVNFVRYLGREKIPWPRLHTGHLKLDKETFKEMAKIYPQIQPLQELRNSLGKLRLNELAVGLDGRNRTLLSPFSTKTSRNAPSNSKFVFGLDKWFRALIRPEEGQALAYIDYRTAEFGIAAALSGDPMMMADYMGGDPYLALAIAAGEAPPDATKTTHSDVRELYKTCTLGVQYGMSSEGLANRIRQPLPYAKELIKAHQERYSTFWTWTNNNIDTSLARGFIMSPFGWRMETSDEGTLREDGTFSNPTRTLLNWPMQAACADMLRIACILALDRGIKILAPIHDAILIESSIDEIEERVAITQQCMIEASGFVLNGFFIGADCDIIKYPSRYPVDSPMWERVCRLAGVQS